MSTSFPQPDPLQPQKPPQQPFGPPPLVGAQQPFGPPPPVGAQQPWSPLAAAPFGGPGQPYPPYSPRSSRPSLLAVASVLFGGGGLFACCCAPIAIPACLMAVITGHAAFFSINRSAGQLTGKPAAAVGLVAGYFGLLLCGSLLIWGMMGGKDRDHAPAQPVPVTASSILDDVESKISTDSGGIAHGNTDEAQALAREFSEAFQLLREELFTKGGKGFSLSGGKFITYCELRPGQCAFVVHVPEYRRFDDDAKESLAELAWIVGQRMAREKLKPGDKLAVGLKGIVFYGSVMTGEVAAPDDDEAKPQTHGDSRSDLLSFFAPPEPAAEPEAEMPEGIQLPGDEPQPPGKTPPDPETDKTKSGGEPEPQ